MNPARIKQHTNGSACRVVKVPLRWLSRFNRLAKIEKHWDGTFDSPYGRGYCTSGSRYQYNDTLEYTFFYEVQP